MKTEYLNNHKITIIQEPSNDLDDDIPDEIEIDLGSIRRNPFAGRKAELSVELEPDLAKYFKNSKQLNTFLRNHIKEIELEIA